MFFRAQALALFLAFVPAAGQAVTVPLTQGADWTEFRFDLDRDGGAWLETEDTLEIITFTFALTNEAKLQVTDGHRSGDQFEVFANGVSLGLTSATSVVGDIIGDDYTTAMTDVRFSSGEWRLGAGDYAVTGFVRVMPEAIGRGAIRLSSIPLPATLPLLLTAGVVLGAASGRRKNTRVGQI